MVGPLYLLSDQLWVLGTATLFDSNLVHTTAATGRVTTVAVQQITVLKCLNFLHFFDHSIFELTLSSGLTVIFKAADPNAMFSWLDMIDDVNSGEYDGSAPTATLPPWPGEERQYLPVHGQSSASLGKSVNAVTRAAVLPASPVRRR